MDKFNNLKKWLNISESDDYFEMKVDVYRKVVAKKDIKKGTILMGIPDDKIINDDIVSTMDNYSVCKSKISSNNSLVALYMLLNENNPRWKEYYEIFPSDLGNFWYYMPTNIKDLIKDTQLSIEINKYYNDKFVGDIKILTDYYPILKDQSNRNKWFKYKILVNSRIFGYSKNNVSCSGMVPLADMLNHDLKNNCDWTYDNTMKKFIIKANQDISKGTELLDSYGVKENIRYYLLYGFVPETITDHNDCVLNINNITITLWTSLEELLKKYNYDKQTMFNDLLNKLKQIPTKRTLKEYKCDNNILLLLNNEKAILKKLLIKIVGMN